ncbi:MAG: DUF2235 domain-containing protein [Gammaproteobacteria bacterium]|nr:DUF2235 domain-containing protein [Gammaproteobacteria bacterium]
MAKNIIFCFDGTDNEPDDAKPKKKWFGLGGTKDSSVTNIFKLHLLFGGDLNNQPTSDSQHSFYFTGVGTYGSWLRQKVNALFAPSEMDVKDILNKAGNYLISHYEDGDKIFIFGFSRGAALARRFAAVAKNRYLKEMTTDKQPVRFLGVFDTVAAMKKKKIDEMPKTKVVFENFTISPLVEEALHLVSLDENRKAFRPTLMNKDPRVEELWFPGAHSDVGGGFANDGLSDVALDFMLKELKRRNLGLSILEPSQVQLDKICVDNNTYPLKFEDLKIEPNPNCVGHVKKRWWPISTFTLGPRLLRVNIQDQESKETPTIFEAMAKRMKQTSGYEPVPVKDEKYFLLTETGDKKECSGYNV